MTSHLQSECMKHLYFSHGACIETFTDLKHYIVRWILISIQKQILKLNFIMNNLIYEWYQTSSVFIHKSFEKFKKFNNEYNPWLFWKDFSHAQNHFCTPVSRMVIYQISICSSCILHIPDFFLHILLCLRLIIFHLLSSKRRPMSSSILSQFKIFHCDFETIVLSFFM